MICTNKVRDWIIAHGLILKGDVVTAAVSGGPDSMAMLSILARLSGEMGFILSAAYFDHSIRKNTAREKRTVEIWCERLGIPLVTGESDVPSIARSRNIGLEEAAREARYTFLESICARSSYAAIGHNRDDQVETVLHHIIRGSGIKGLTGIPVRRGIFIRPVMCCTGAELKEHCIKHGIRYAVDQSNRDLSFVRNRIRHRLLPSIRKDFNPAIDEAILRLSGNALEGIETLEEGIADLVPEITANGAVILDAASAAGLPDYRLYLLIDTILRDRFGVHQDVDRPHYEAVRSLIRSGRSGRSRILPHGVKVSAEHGSVRFESAQESRRPQPPDEIMLPGDGDFDLPGWNMTVSVRTRRPDDISAANTLPNRASLASVSFPVRVRPRRDGDRLVPFGMKGRKKLSDVMIDRKIPLRVRGSLPVFEDGSGILWVPGVVADERTRITGATRRVTTFDLTCRE